MALAHTRMKMLSRGSRNTVRALAYRAGCKLYDEQTGEVFDYRKKDVHHVELLIPNDAPEWTQDLKNLIVQDRQKGVQQFSDLCEQAEKRKDAQVYREWEFSLHRELSDEQNMELARELLQDQVCGLGMAVLVNFHFDVDEETGERKPHCHALFVTRRLTEEGFSEKKVLDWNRRDLAGELREQHSSYSNFYFKKLGLEIRIDPRSYREQGIDLEPQPKLGMNVRDMETRHQRTEARGQKINDDEQAATDKGKTFQEVQLRNLYRIMVRPEIIFEIVSKKHITFMWGDVEKALARYVDDPELFSRINLQLQNSKELVTLKSQDSEIPPSLKESAIYTTRDKLHKERSLIETIEALSTRLNHRVNPDDVARIIEKHNEALKEYGGLSKDQKQAIHHIVKEDQVSCVVGYAGAGKTTALKAAKEIWETRGYKVYGLAPTGKAARNLEEEGINAQTLHKFLKDYEKGKNHFNKKSVLILDEAGMVDLDRGTAFLKAVEKIGVKAVLVGDGAQLEPVEAGAFFRLVTHRIEPAKLETIVRQNSPWQREATQLFGQYQTEQALRLYLEKGAVRFVEERVPSLEGLIAQKDYRGLVEHYTLSRRMAGNLYHAIVRDLKEQKGMIVEPWKHLQTHEEYGLYEHWRNSRQQAADTLIQNLEYTRSLLKEHGVDPYLFAEGFLQESYDPSLRKRSSEQLVKEWALLSPDPDQPRFVCESRGKTSRELIASWEKSLMENPDLAHLILAYTNQDTRSLNENVRQILKERGLLEKEEYCPTILRHQEDDFGKIREFKEQRAFAKGDRLLFTRNDQGLGVKNGLLGTIEHIDQNTLQVKLDKSDKVISFAPRLYPYFDQGWAVTIHKSQAATADKTFMLATRNTDSRLAYVGMTRHRDAIEVFGSTLDFWNGQEFIKCLSSTTTKLSAFDYIDPDQALRLMHQDDTIISRFFNRLRNQVKAMGYVAQRGVQDRVDSFLRKPPREWHELPSLQRSLSEAERSKGFTFKSKENASSLMTEADKEATRTLPSQLATTTHVRSQDAALPTKDFDIFKAQEIRGNAYSEAHGGGSHQREDQNNPLKAPLQKEIDKADSTLQDQKDLDPSEVIAQVELLTYKIETLKSEDLVQEAKEKLHTLIKTIEKDGTILFKIGLRDKDMSKKLETMIEQNSKQNAAHKSFER